MNITGVDHTSYTVSSLERSLEFYVGLLGCQVLWQRVIENDYFRQIVGFPGCVVKAAHLRVPGSDHHIELFEYVTPAGDQPELRTNNVGNSHLSFIVADLPAAYAELKAKGVKFRSPPVLITTGANKGGWGAYMLDPDGITMELFQSPMKDRVD